MTGSEYLSDPCGASSLAFWKTNAYPVPPDMRIVRGDAFTGAPEGWRDEVYFKLLRELDDLPEAPVPPGYALTALDDAGFAAHIAACCERERATAEELARCRLRATYRPALRLALQSIETGEVAASGIAELDASIGEGVLEWIQVTPAHRRRGLGRFVVTELLRRMRGEAAFTTVSGRLHGASDPYALYTACGFHGAVLWHVMRRR